MKRTNICGLDRNELTKAGVSRSLITLDEVKADAKHTEVIQIVPHRNTGRILVVMPGGAVFGTTQMMFVDEAENLAGRYGAFITRLDEEVG